MFTYRSKAELPYPPIICFFSVFICIYNCFVINLYNYYRLIYLYIYFLSRCCPVRYVFFSGVFSLIYTYINLSYGK